MSDEESLFGCRSAHSELSLTKPKAVMAAASLSEPPFMLRSDHNNTNSPAQAVADGILMALNFGNGITGKLI